MAQFNALQPEVLIATKELNVERQIAENVYFIINSF